MDGVGSTTEGDDKMVIVLGATNYPWELDEALRRRTEKRIYIPLPDGGARSELFRINMKNISTDESVKLEELAERSDGYSGADITNVCRDASFMAMRARIKGLTPDQIKKLNQEEINLPVTKKDFDESFSKISSSVSKEDIKKHENWLKEFGSA